MNSKIMSKCGVVVFSWLVFPVLLVFQAWVAGRGVLTRISPHLAARNEVLPLMKICIPPLEADAVLVSLRIRLLTEI